MKPAKMVCNMKYAKQLKDMGIRQDSMFYWIPVQRTGVLAYAPCMLEDTFVKVERLGKNRAPL